MQASQSLTFIGFLTGSDLMTQITTALLLFGSVCCWAIIIDKWMLLGRLNNLANDFEESFWSGGSLEKLYDRIGSRTRDPMSAVFAAGMGEWRLATGKGLITRGNPMAATVNERIERVMSIAMAREMNRIESSMTMLANIAAAGPLLGLFGTIWGVINSFAAIAASGSGSLSAVAPGISMALYTTALGLIAAIPSVLAYNQFSTLIARYADRLDTFASEFSSILSRHMEEKEAARA